MLIRYLVCIALLLGLAPLRADNHTERIQRIETKARIAGRMAELHVPAVSIAVVEDGRLVWTRAWGSANAGTIFQAASISKPVATTAALHMSQYGNFTLDENVNGKLKSWNMPGDRVVTLRGIMTHSAGVTVHGFPGYAAGGPFPSLIQILNGEPPANTAPIRVDIEPGLKVRYSGGGFTVMQQLMIDRLNWTFPEIMQRMVLGKLGMKRSTFQQPLPDSWRDNAAAGHLSDGSVIAGNWHTYPEMAAAGLWTTPSDLARWAIELRDAYLGKSNKVIEPATAREMLKARKEGWGLGVQLRGEGKTLRFSHGGSNRGFKCGFEMVVESGKGAFVMTNGDRGGALANELIRAVSAEYAWPAVER